MACPVCGNASACSHEHASTTILIDPEVSDDSEQKFALSLDQPAALRMTPVAPPPVDLDDEYWRQEVASRVQQHRARRRRRVDPNATMELNFASEGLYAVPEADSVLPPIQALATAQPLLAVRPSAVAQPLEAAQPEPPAQPWPSHEPLAASASCIEETWIEETLSAPMPETELPGIHLPDPDDPRPEPYKVIQFPRAVHEEPVSRVAAPEEILELAEPVLDTPRILDAPESVDTPAFHPIELMRSFAGIELEAHRHEEPEEVPPVPAPLTIRVFAGLVDLLIMLAAGLVFLSVFLGLASGLPPVRLLLPSAVAAGALLWLLYQYAFLVHSAGTPGMRMAQLELYTFAGERASTAQRRWRALTTVLSAGSLGLGYFWAYVDEDTLCWHDRITGTCVKEETCAENEDAHNMGLQVKADTLI